MKKQPKEELKKYASSIGEEYLERRNNGPRQHEENHPKSIKESEEEMTGEALRRWRISIGASQAEIAKRAGVSRQTIVAYEQKSELPMTKIIEAYGLVIQPMVCSISENLDNFTDRLKEEIEEKTGRKCQIKINIELCGEEEE